MRLNGTYIDRLIINIIPIIIIVSVLIHFTKEVSLKTNFIVGLMLTLFLWIGDSYVIYRRQPKSLNLENDIIIDHLSVSPQDIENIKKITYKPGLFWTWVYFVFTVKSGEVVNAITVIEKPQTLIETLMGKESKTLTPLFRKFPDLKDKFTHQTTIHSFR